jgi:HPt (histidine-containing phosphotransfer) domain-containing protein
MSDVREEAQRQMDTVRHEFEARLSDMIEEIAQAWEAVKSRPNLARLRKLAELTHSLAGNAGFFGLQEVSRIASALEQSVDHWIDHGTLSNAAVFELNRLVQVLRMRAPGCSSVAAVIEVVSKS